jgi:hypothetical protein
LHDSICVSKFMKKIHKKLLILVAILVLIDFGIFWFLSRVPKDSKENVLVTKIDLSSEDKLKDISSRFPIPILNKSESLIDGYVMDYKDKGVVITGVSYFSEKTVSDIHFEYTELLKKKGFTINEKETSSIKGLIYASKDQNNLDVVIDRNVIVDKKIKVQLVYTEIKKQ